MVETPSIKTVAPTTIFMEEKKMGSILWTVISVLFVLWLVGMVAGFAGNLIHLLLVVAVVMFLVNLFNGRRTTT